MGPCERWSGCRNGVLEPKNLVVVCTPVSPFACCLPHLLVPEFSGADFHGPSPRASPPIMWPDTVNLTSNKTYDGPASGSTKSIRIPRAWAVDDEELLSDREGDEVILTFRSCDWALAGLERDFGCVVGI